jgi:hypothetical protein
MKPKILTVKLQHFEMPAVRVISSEIIKADLWRMSKGKPTTMDPGWLAYHAYEALYGEYRSPVGRKKQCKPRYQRVDGLFVMGTKKRRARRGKPGKVCPVLAFPTVKQNP